MNSMGKGRRDQADTLARAIRPTVENLEERILLFKPFTPVQAGMDALADAIDDGKVTINNQQYTVNATLRTALTNFPDYYRAGSVGPDGFPDLVFGQSIIHPENTGLYLRRLYEKAWSAQTDARYNTQQRQQILAWTYGYMNHAAGDLWAHTLVNEFGQGVFPDVVDLTDPQKAAIAARHILVEGYIGDATPGFDGNPDRM